MAGITGASLARAHAAVLAVLVSCVCASSALAASQPIELAAPYEYMGWGDPQPPAEVLERSGVQDLTFAFILDRGRCSPEWDGRRPLLGGVDQRAIESVRSAGGEVDVSFGGWSGRKLGSSCRTPAALAGAYEKVIAAYSLGAIDIDIEHGELASAKVRRRVIEALALVHSADPSLEISITFPADEEGPEAQGLSLIADAAAIGLQPSAWTIMPFDFGRPSTSMGEASIRAAQGLARDLASAYAISEADAFAHAGISSMDGDTDEADETVGLEEFRTILAFAAKVGLARVAFWSVNRDRPCGGAGAEAECSAVAQEPLAYTRLLAAYHG